MAKQNKTAKDLAWDKERSKLKSRIRHLEDENFKLSLKIEDKSKKIKEYEDQRELIEKILKMTPDELDKFMKNYYKMYEYVTIIMSIPGWFS